jgi:hypothetical protein
LYLGAGTSFYAYFYTDYSYQGEKLNNHRQGFIPREKLACEKTTDAGFTDFFANCRYIRNYEIKTVLTKKILIVFQTALLYIILSF